MKEKGINEAVVYMLCERGLKISAAESCTGGMFTSMIVDVPGASDILEESIITYSNDAKIRELGVDQYTLETQGAVSAQTAMEMAIGIRKHTKADIGISITGIAGPGGGTKEKPVGTVYAGISTGKDTYVYKMSMNGSRTEVRTKTCMCVLEELKKKIEEDF